MKQQLTLQEKHEVYLGILKEFDKFCSSFGLTYYMGCGTLIGAVRHKGFIPWDDDLDVFIPEPDFKVLLEKYTSECFELVTCYSDKAHPHVFARLVDNRTYSQTGLIKTYGLGIDVYTIYGAPSSRSEQQFHMDEVFRYIRRKHFWRKCRSRMCKLNLLPFYYLFNFFMNINIKKAIAEFEKYDYNDCEYIWPFGGGRLNLRKELYGNPIRIQFEDGFFCAPEHYHEVLTAGYGDYMQLPPESDRHPYHVGSFYWRKK